MTNEQYIGLKIEYGNEKPFFTKSFHLNRCDDKIIGQLIRDNDLSFLLKLCDPLTISLISYQKKDTYKNLNNNDDENNYHILGVYNVLFDSIIDEHTYPEYCKGTFTKVLDVNNNLEISFTTINHNDEYFCLTTPSFICSSEYIK